MTANSVFREVSGAPAHDQHVRAASDLVARIQDGAIKRIADVRAGPWSTRALLAERFPDAKMVEMDPSRMNSRSPAGSGNEYDLIFSSADLGLPTSLRRMLPKLARRLSSGGRLAVQFPNNLYEPNRALMRQVAAEGPWAKTLLPVAKSQPFNETMEGLYTLLTPICASVEVWETTYLCVLENVAALVDFMKASGLEPFLSPLTPSSQRKFLDRYTSELARAYPPQPDGRVLLRFPRIFLLAMR